MYIGLLAMAEFKTDLKHTEMQVLKWCLISLQLKR